MMIARSWTSCASSSSGMAMRSTVRRTAARGSAASSRRARLRAHDADERHAFPRRPAEIVREGELPPARDRGDLALPGLAAELQPRLEEHPEARSADRMAERLEAAVGVHRQLALEVEGACEYLLPRGAARGEAEVLHQ